MRLFNLNGLFPVYYGGEEGFSVSQITEDLAYVVDSTGWKLFKRNGVSIALVAIEKLSGAEALSPHINFKAKKMPFSLLEKVIAFFKEVYRKYQSEAVGYLYYSAADGAWDFVVPKQSASAAHADYEGAPQRRGWKCAGTIHSHGSMSAFHSGTDDADEEFFDGLHITIGRCDQLNVEFSTSLVVNGQRQMLEIWDVVADFSMPSAPAEWVNSVKLPAPHVAGDPFTKEASDLYERYYLGDLPEETFLRDLQKIKKRADEAAEAEQKRLASMVTKKPGRQSSSKKLGFRQVDEGEDYYLNGGR